MQAVHYTFQAINVASGSSFVTCLFVNCGLGTILGKLKGLSVICTLYCLNFCYPALAMELGATL